MKTSQAIRRDAALLRRDTDTGARRATFRLCTPAIDRHGTIILPEGVDLTAHKAAGSPFLWMHEIGDGFGSVPPPDVVIGRVVEYEQSSKALDITVEFDDDGPQGLASRCWAKVQAGLLRSVSIGASPVTTETRKVAGADVLVYTKTELWEASLVILGSNREALRIDRAAALRALDNLTKETAKMDKAALCKLLGIEETADREAAEKACMDYLVKTDDAEARKAAAAALDEYFKEAAPAEKPAEKPEDPPAERAADEPAAKDEDVETMRAANAELTRALAAAQASIAAAPKPADVAAETVKREAALAADVDKWITEGRARREERAIWLERHRNGKAANVVRHIPKGAWTTSQRLAGGAVGTPVTDLPAAPETPVKREARALVAQARGLDRGGNPKPPAGGEAPSATKSEAKRLVEQARGLRG